MKFTEISIDEIKNDDWIYFQSKITSRRQNTLLKIVCVDNDGFGFVNINGSQSSKLWEKDDILEHYTQFFRIGE